MNPFGAIKKIGCGNNDVDFYGLFIEEWIIFSGNLFSSFLFPMASSSGFWHQHVLKQFRTEVIRFW